MELYDQLHITKIGNMILNFLFFIFIKLKALWEKKYLQPTTKPKWDKNSYDKKQNKDMGISIFAYLELQFQRPNSTTLSKKKNRFFDYCLSDETWSKILKIKKIDFWGSDLIDDRLIEKKINTPRNQNPQLIER